MIKVAKAVIPIFKRFAIIGNRFEDQLYYRRFAEEVPKFSQEYEFIDLTGLSLDDVRRRAAALPDDSAIFYIGVNADQETTYMSAAEVLPYIADVANRPIIVDVETLFGFGCDRRFHPKPRPDWPLHRARRAANFDGREPVEHSNCDGQHLEAGF